MARKEEIIEKAVNKYKCLQEGDFFIDWCPTYIALRWNAFMDKYINLARVKQVAKFLRKYTDLPIYSSIGYINI